MMRNGRPGELVVIAYFRKCGAVSVAEESYFGVPADKEFALARVNTVARERVNLDLLYSRSNVSHRDTSEAFCTTYHLFETQS